jgi:hypothetical protein
MNQHSTGRSYINGRYATALTTEERLVLAMMAAVAAYFIDDETGSKMPGQGFLVEYLKPFIDREKLEWERERVRMKMDPAAVVERKLESKLSELIDICERKIQGFKKL